MSAWTRLGEIQNAIYALSRKYDVQVRQEGTYIRELAHLVENLAERLVSERLAHVPGSEDSGPAPTDGPDYHADLQFHREGWDA